jgi:hypothetical protein
MQSFLVTWAINVDAESPEEAAQQAFQDYFKAHGNRLGRVFTVQADDGEGETTLVDLAGLS